MDNNLVKLQAALIALAMCACSSSKDNDTKTGGSTTGGSTNTPGNTMSTPGTSDMSGTKPGTTNGGSMTSGSGGSGAPSKGDNGGSSGGNAGAGSAGNAASGTGGAGGDMMMAGDMNADPRGKCTIDSGFPDDNACILPPDPKEGMQIHIGPTDYNDPDQINMYIFQAGVGGSECINFHTPNNEEIYLPDVRAQRPHGHAPHHQHDVQRGGHDGGGFSRAWTAAPARTANIIDNLPGASKAYMPRNGRARERGPRPRDPAEHRVAGRHALLQLHARATSCASSG